MDDFPPPKSIDENWIDWESYAFGFGYGSGEPYTVAALKTFLAACPATGPYDYGVLERECGPAVAWLLIVLLDQGDEVGL